MSDLVDNELTTQQHWRLFWWPRVMWSLGLFLLTLTVATRNLPFLQDSFIDDGEAAIQFIYLLVWVIALVFGFAGSPHELVKHRFPEVRLAMLRHTLIGLVPAAVLYFALVPPPNFDGSIAMGCFVLFTGIAIFVSSLISFRY